MERIKRYIMSSVLLAAVNLFLRGVSVSFNAYIAAKIGEVSMGLFTLVMSVYGLAVTLATSGVNLAAVRLTSEKLALLSDKGATASDYRKCVRGIILSCVIYSLFFGVVTGTLLYIFSPYIGKYLLCDVRTVLSLRVLAFSLVPISLTAALSGYFTGVRKVYKNAFSVMIEQAMKIAITSGALCVTVTSFTDKVEYSCLAVVGGAAVAEGFSLAVNVVLYLFDSKRPAGIKTYKAHRDHSKTTVKQVCDIAMPVAVGAYARQGLSTAEHLCIPWGMKLSGLGSERAMAAYGVLQGMVFPLILFPSAVISSAGGLLIPELAEFMTLGDKKNIRRTVRKVFSVTVLFAVGCSVVMYAFSDLLGMSVYSSNDAAYYIKLCSPLVPVMYFDTSVDCMLKGLGEQVHSMRINIADSALSLILVLILVPFFGISGYILSVYVCESMNCVMSVIRLYKVTGVGISIRGCIMPPVIGAFCAIILCSWLPNRCTAVRNEIIWLILCAGIYFAVSVFLEAVLVKNEKYSKSC